MLLARRPAKVRGDADLHRWTLVVMLGMAQIASWGVLYYAFAVFLIPMQEDLNLSVAELTGAFSLALGVSAVAGLGVGRYLDRHSPRLLMTAGSLLAVVLVLAWSRIGSAPELYLVFAGIGIAMAAVLYEPVFIIIMKMFSTRRREALTALTMIAGFASLVFSPLSERLIAALGWREGLVLLAGVLAVVTVPIHALFLRPFPLEGHPTSDAVDGKRSDGVRAERLPGFRLLVLSFVLATFASSSVAVLLIATLISRGHDPGFAALTAGLVGVGQIPGRALFAIAGRRLSVGGLTAAPFGLMAVSLALLTVADETWTVVFAIVFGIGAGMSTLLRPTLVAELYGRERLGRNSGLAAAFVTTARAAAPLIAAGAAMVSGGYTSLLWILAGATAVAALTAHRAVLKAIDCGP